MPYVDTGQVSLFFEDAASGGVPTLLLHELGGSSESWRAVIHSLAADRRVIAADFRCAGRSEKPVGTFDFAELADDLSALLQALSVDQPVDVIGAALGSLAGALPTVADITIQGIFPFCFTPEMYVERPDYAQALADFVRGRPAQPREAFLSQTEAVLAHDAVPALGEIEAPTLVTFGAHDLVTSTRFADPLTGGIAGSELVVFDHLSHAALHEDPEAFNGATLDFLLRH